MAWPPTFASKVRSAMNVGRSSDLRAVALSRNALTPFLRAVPTSVASQLA